MAQATPSELSRRSAMALAAALAATVVTAVVTVGGLRQWQAQTAHQPAPAAAVQTAPPAAIPVSSGSWEASD